jgi:hypothetical protein
MASKRAQTTRPLPQDLKALISPKKGWKILRLEKVRIEGMLYVENVH